ncbi:Protein CBG27321 [Caenorhabditis briggsae]|uniref:Protein CBG27321 n=1 Tax=Caenorhabditis briggsae TaxID=6238 RepID=B6IG53_CAEBR|nr:Protein CBG27321 [Caenorhabditis briggsae]CAR98883.1 Protein CBG27321 [Caenorhabditis briggsae]
MPLFYLHSYYFGTSMGPSDTVSSIISSHQVIAPLAEIPRSETSVEESEASEFEVVQEAVDSDEHYSSEEELEDSGVDDVQWRSEMREEVEKKEKKAKIRILKILALHVLLIAALTSNEWDFHVKNCAKSMKFMEKSKKIVIGIGIYFKPPLSRIAFQQLQHELNKDGDVFLEALKIGSALKKFNQLDFHEQLCNKPWTPLPSKFEGVQEYLEFIGRNGTAYEEVMYLSTLEFASSFRPATFFRMTHSSGGGFWKNELVQASFDHSGEGSTCSIENGLLTVRQFYEGPSGEQKKQYTRIYYLKTSDLIRSVDSLSY